MDRSEVETEPLSVGAPPLRRPRLMRQDWRDLAFVHWAVDPSLVAALMPPGVRPDVFEGRTYVGLIPFRMVDAGFAHGPAVPYLGTFFETNVRLYSVDGTGRRGIVFRSLDADRAAVVLGARSVFGLPYRWARMRHSSVPVEGGVEHRYATRLRRRGGQPVISTMRLRVLEPVPPSPLDLFLTARWGLHVRYLGRTWYIPNTHEPWTFRRAEVLGLEDGLLVDAGLPGVASRPPDHVVFSDGVRTEFGRPVPATRARPMVGRVVARRRPG